MGGTSSKPAGNADSKHSIKSLFASKPKDNKEDVKSDAVTPYQGPPIR